MTRKDYELIARVLRDNQPSPQFNPEFRGPWTKLVEELSAALMLDNPRFDQRRFGRACTAAKLPD